MRERRRADARERSGRGEGSTRSPRSRSRPRGPSRTGPRARHAGRDRTHRRAATTGRVHRGREDQHAARSADPGHLVEQTGVVIDVLDHLEGEHGIEGVVRERERDAGRRASVRPPRAASRSSAWAEASMNVEVATGAVGRSPGPISRTEPAPTRGASQFHTCGRTCTTWRDPLQWSSWCSSTASLRSIPALTRTSGTGPSVPVVEAASIPGVVRAAPVARTRVRGDQRVSHNPTTLPSLSLKYA